MSDKSRIMNTPAFAVYSKWPDLAPNLLDPMRLRGLIDIWRDEAYRRSGPDSESFTEKAIRAKGALKDLYGIDYESPKYVQ